VEGEELEVVDWEGEGRPRRAGQMVWADLDVLGM
jgi:hypothetical protein